MREYIKLVESLFTIDYDNLPVGLLLEDVDSRFLKGTPLTDEDIENAALPEKVRAKLFANRDLPNGTVVAVRLNLNGKVMKDGVPFFIQTVHARTAKGEPLGYDGAVTVKNGRFDVNQHARALIAAKKENKFPMAAVIGHIIQKAPSLTGVEVRFNPMSEHLFTRVDNGLAVKSADEVTVFNTRCYARGNITYWHEDEAPKARDNIPSHVKFKPRDGEHHLGEPKPEAKPVGTVEPKAEPKKADEKTPVLVK